jgi:hypothetical protein
VSKYDAMALDDKSKGKPEVRVGIHIQVTGKIAPSTRVMVLRSGFEMDASLVQSS